MPSNDKLLTVVFINPPGPSKLYRSIVCTFISKANYIWQPQDFINLSAQVPQDYKLRFFDCSVNNITQENLFEEISSCDPIVSVVALSSVIYNDDISFIKSFRSRFSNIKLLVLGDIFLEKVFWEKGLEYADGIILNSIDIDLANYIKCGVSNSPNFIIKNASLNNKTASRHNGAPQKVSIGIPRHELFVNKKYRFPFVKSYLYGTVSTQFGCPYHCNYCSWCNISVSYRDYNEVLDEIEKVHNLGIRDLFFGDPSFGFPRENAIHLLEGMVRKKFSIRWICYANPALLDSEILKLMKKAGCHTVIIGVDDENLDMLKDKHKRSLSASTLMEFCKECSLLQIQICGDFIIGLNSDEMAVNRIVNFAKRLRLDYASFNIFTVLLGSEVRENLIREGKVDPYTIGFDTSGTFGQRNENLNKLRNMAIKKFYLRTGYLLRRITNISSFIELKIQLEEMVAMFKNHLIKRKNN